MRRGLSRHLSYANVMATAAVFIALGGSSYAALKITGAEVRERVAYEARSAEEHARRQPYQGVAAGKGAESEKR